MTNSPIPSIKSITVLQDAVASGAKLTVSEHATDVVKQSTTLTLTVVNINRAQVSLQIQSSQQKIQIPLDAINAKGQLAKGDVLILTAVKGEQAKLIAQHAAALQNQAISEQQARILSKAWTDISMHDVAKAHLYPSSSASLENSVLNGSTNAQLKLASNILKYGNLSSQNAPTINVTTSVKNTANKSVSLQIQGFSAAQLNLRSSALNEYHLSANDQINLIVKQGRDGAFFDSIKGTNAVGNFTISHQHLAQINKSLSPSTQISLDNIIKRSMLVTSDSSKKQDIYLLPGKPEITKNIIGLEQFTNVVMQHERNKNANESNILVSQIKRGDRVDNLIQFIVKPSVLSVDVKLLHKDAVSTTHKPTSVPTSDTDIHLSLENNEGKKQQKNESATAQSNATLRPTKLLLESLISKLPSVTSAQALVANQLQTEIRTLLSHTSQVSENSITELNNVLKALMFDSSKGNLSKNAAPADLNYQMNEVLRAVTKLQVNFTKHNDHEKLLNSTNTEANNLQSDVASGDKPEETLTGIKPIDIKSLQSSLLTDRMINQAINTPKPPSTMMDALVNLLILRLIPQSSAPVNIQHQIAQMMTTKMLPQNGNKLTTQSNNKQNADIDSIDTNRALLKSLGSVFNQTSLHSLRSAEMSVQAQDSLYFILPNLLNATGKDIELKIQRESQKNKKDDLQSKQHWKLDMKLDIGRRGEVLAKTDLTGQHLKLSLYASNETLKNTIDKHLPTLLKRLKGLGIAVTESHAYVAKIPKTLMNTQLNTMKTYA